jgi:hypothetical protein
MKGQMDYRQATYTPQHHKTFPGALDSFFQNECPQLGGQRTRQVLVQFITQMIDRFYPETSRLRQGQIQWTTVHKDEQASTGKKITQSRLTPVILDLIQAEDAMDRANGKKLRDIKKEAVARLYQQAYEQNGCMTHAELAILLKLSANCVGTYTREWEAEHGKHLPRRGVIHDLGPTLTHKKIIVQKLYLHGQSVEQVCRETNHSPEAVHRYIKNFKQVLLCHRKELSIEETAYAIKISPRLVREYHALVAELSTQNTILEAILNENPVN